MMPVIRITDATWERMKTHARPLEDTPDDIVRRALDALEGKPASPKQRPAVGRPSRAAIGQKLPQKAFRAPLLLTLAELGGAGSLDDIRRAMHPKVASQLNEADYAIVSSGEERWWNATCWERSELVKTGHLLSTSPRGRWELSEQGRLEVRRLKSNS
jgi:hypothetical protein